MRHPSWRSSRAQVQRRIARLPVAAARVAGTRAQRPLASRAWRASTSPTRSTGSTRPGGGCRSRSAPRARTPSPRSSRSSRRAFEHLRAYSSAGVRPDCDFFLWKITERYEDLGELGAALNATPLAGWLETPYSYLATTKASQYTSARRRAQDHAARLAVPRRLSVREDAAVVRAARSSSASARWTSTSAIGAEFPSIHNHTTYSFGIDDQEFMTAFECDEPADFMHLMLTLRETEASSLHRARHADLRRPAAGHPRRARRARRRGVARRGLSRLAVACAGRARCATSRSRRARG